MIDIKQLEEASEKLLELQYSPKHCGWLLWSEGCIGRGIYTKKTACR